MGAVLSGKGTGKGAGRGPEQYAKPTAPPAFDGFRPPIEEWERKLTVWEQANPNLQNRGALLVQSLNGEPFRLVTTTMQPEEWTREAVYDEYTGEVVQQEGYATVKQLILDRYKKRRIVQVYDKATRLVLHLRRRGRPMRFYLQEFEMAVIDAKNYGLQMSDELTGILAVMFADLGPVERTQVLSSMQAKSDAQGGQNLTFVEIAAILQAVGDAATLGGVARPKQTLHTLQDPALEIAEEDQDWQAEEQGDWYDAVVEDLGDFDEDPEGYTVLLAQSLEGKSSEEVATLVARAMKGRGKGGRGRGAPAGRGRGRSRGPWRPPGAKKEATEKCPHCNRPGHGKDHCWKLHPEQVPEHMKESWAKREEERKKQGKKVLLSGLTLSSLSSLQKETDTVALADTCAEGDGMVAGTRWATRFFQEVKARTDVPPVVKIPTSETMRHFGAGNAKTMSTYKVPIWWGGRWIRCRLDVVGGASSKLPCLLEYDFQANLGLVPVPRHDAIYRLAEELKGTKDGFKLTPEASRKVGGLLGLKLLGQDCDDALDKSKPTHHQNPTLNSDGAGLSLFLNTSFLRYHHIFFGYPRENFIFSSFSAYSHTCGPLSFTPGASAHTHAFLPREVPHEV